MSSEFVLYHYWNMALGQISRTDNDIHLLLYLWKCNMFCVCMHPSLCVCVCVWLLRVHTEDRMRAGKGWTAEPAESAESAECWAEKCGFCAEVNKQPMPLETWQTLNQAPNLQIKRVSIAQIIRVYRVSVEIRITINLILLWRIFSSCIATSKPLRHWWKTLSTSLRRHVSRIFLADSLRTCFPAGQSLSAESRHWNSPVAFEQFQFAGNRECSRNKTLKTWNSWR